MFGKETHTHGKLQSVLRNFGSRDWDPPIGGADP